MKNYSFLLLILTLSLTFNFANAQEITVFPGFWSMEYYQDDQRVSKDEVSSLFAANEEVNELWTKANANATLGYISFGAEMVFAGWAGYAAANDEDLTAPLVGVVGTAILTSVFLSNASKKRKDAILKYNSSFDKKVSLDLNVNQYGLGLAVRF